MYKKVYTMVTGGEEMAKIRGVGGSSIGVAINPNILRMADMKENDQVIITTKKKGEIIIKKVEG